VRLGVTTATGDAEGEVLERRDVRVTREEVEAVLRRFVGHIAQVPPRHAALKYQGRNYYEYAREGIEIPRQARDVTVESLALGACNMPDFDLVVRCSKGTYVRVLAEDIGRALGCGAHLSALRRTATGGLTLETGCTLEELASASEEGRDARLLPPDTLVAALPRIDLDDAEAIRLAQGQGIARAALADASYRVYAENEFAGVASAVDGILRPRRLTASAASASIGNGMRGPPGSV
jgi:tRNA pseudouridine55 synthase